MTIACLEQRTAVRLILIIVLALGICFRLVNLDHKIYWYDETFTSLRSSGYSEAEVVQHFSQTAIVQVQDLQRYQQPDPQRGSGATWHSLAIEDPQHSPLYYILSSYWSRWVGHDVAAMRLLPALLSLLAFPGACWLCWELFAAAARTDKFTDKFTDKSQVGWMAIGLIAVSPFQVLYAQEAREYSLWSGVVLLATAALLRAIRVRTTLGWLVYAVALAVSLYTFLFSLWIAVAHAVYLLILSKLRFSRTVAAYLLATLLALAAFSPWLWVTAENLHQIQTVTSWTTHNRSLISLAMSWGSMLGRLFYDRGSGAIDRTIQIAFIVLIAVGFYTLCRQTGRSIWLLLLALTGVPALILILPDLIWGGARSTSPRYLIPALGSIQLVVAYLLATKLDTKLAIGTVGFRQQAGRHGQPWRWITAAVFTAGILSNLTISQAQIWWIKPHSQENLAVAQMINPIARPLLISDAETADLLSLSYVLDSDTDLLIRPRCYTCSIASPKLINPAILVSLPEILPHHRSIFLYHPRATQEWRRSLQQVQNYHLEAASPALADILWKLVFNVESEQKHQPIGD